MPGRGRREGWHLSWIFIAALGIIWAAFLLPFGSRRASPASTVEEFERKMDLLAETNRTPGGRYVLVPRKGERFMGPRDRERVRVRRRRRIVFTFLLEATALTLLIGMFPPLRDMLVGTIILAGLLVAYTVLLLSLRAEDRRRHRRQRAARLAGATRFERVPAASMRRLSYAYPGNGRSNGNGHSGANGNGHSTGEERHGVPARVIEEEELLGSGVRIIEDDVHVIVRRSSELERERLDALAR